MFALDDFAERSSRAPARAAKSSYTRSLLDKGSRGAAKKFGEEATESVIAAVSEEEDALPAEAADVLYHLLVVLKAREVPSGW